MSNNDFEKKNMVWKFLNTLKGVTKEEESTYYICYWFYLMKKYNYNVELIMTERRFLFEKIMFDLDNNKNVSPIEKSTLFDAIKVFMDRHYIENNVDASRILIDVFRNSSIELIKAVVEQPLNAKGSRSDLGIPQEVNSLIKYVLDIKKGDNIFLNISGYENTIRDFVNGENRVTAEIINYEVAVINRIKSIVLDYENSVNIVTPEQLFEERNFDKIFNNYPIGLRMDRNRMERIIYKNRFIQSLIGMPSISADWFFINESLSQLKENGKIAVLMANGALFKIADKNIKEELVKRGLIEKIISLPERIFSCTAIQLNIVVLSNNNKDIEIIDASQEFKEVKNTNRRVLDTDNIIKILELGHSNKKVIVPINKVKEDFDLRVSNYIGKKEIKLYNPVKLSKCIYECFRGYQKPLKEYFDNNGDYEILTVSDLEDGIISNSLNKINGKDISVDRYLLKENDVLVSSHGTINKIGVATNIGNRKIIVTGNFNVIRVDKNKLNPFYLEAFLNSEQGKNILENISTGMVISSISPNKLSEIEISMMDLEKQNQIMRKYTDKKEQLTFAKEHLKNLQSQIADFFDNSIAKELK